MPESSGLNRLQWEEKLAAIGEHLRSMGSSATLEIIGAWPVREAGLGKEDVALYVRRIRDSRKRQTADENLVYLEAPR